MSIYDINKCENGITMSLIYIWNQGDYKDINKKEDKNTDIR